MTQENPPLDDLVAAVTPRVVEEALEQAVAQAREELAGRLAQAIVQRALSSGSASDHPASGSRQPAAGARRPTEPQPAAEPAAGHAAGSTADARRPTDREPAAAPAPAARAQPRQRPDHGGTGLYAFAIIPARPVDLAGVTGIDGQAPLRIIQHAELGLVVSEMPLDLMDDVSEEDLSETSPLATLARRHDEVVRAVFENGPVLPLRFGTVVADDDGARTLLEDQSTLARRRLSHLDTHREWGVRVRRDPAAVTHDDDAGDDRRAMTGTSYLAARREALQRSQQAEQQTAALTARVEDALAEQAADLAHRGGGPGSGVLADLAYLVPVAGEGVFLDAADRLSGEVAHEGLLLEVTGPWPPYSFATLQSAHQDAAAAGVVGSA